MAFVRSNGPLIPRTVAKEFKLDTTFAGAYLSELVGDKSILVSSTKIGGSPTYYTSEHVEKLQELFKYLSDKDRKTYKLLQQKKILRDKEQPPLVRACLRALKDFAIPLQVNIQPGPELFWKWYLLTKEEAEPIVKRMLEQPKVKEEKQEVTEPKVEQQKLEEKKVPEPKEEKKAPKEHKAEVQKKEVSKKIPKKHTETANEFLALVTKHFAHTKIEVVHSEIIKKSEIDFLIKVPSMVGKLEYYCKAKKKKKCNEGDLSSAFVTGQTKKLPVLFITTGELTKKAQTMLDKEFKNHLVFKKI